ncbi:MAG: release factor glutamine methyltransferase [Thermodesulfobacteriota bacterium]|nr:release factor glutamine methyltransferase [Thermodesulfobacteriota bacterium]
MTIQACLEEAVNTLRKAGIGSPRLDAEVLLCHIMQADRAQLLMRGHSLLTDQQLRCFRQWVARRELKEPVAYIVGEKEFWSLSFYVNRHVLIPRPETEILVEEVLRVIPGIDRRPVRILEIGAGSGAISVALAVSQENMQIVATDISPAAVAVARQNAVKAGVAARIDFFVGYLFADLAGVFDVIVSNPPYISDAEFLTLPDDVRKYEPPEALLGGAAGISLHREIIAGGLRYLAAGGYLVMEIGATQRQRLAELLEETGSYANISCRQDYAGCDRVILARRL